MDTLQNLKEIIKHKPEDATHVDSFEPDLSFRYLNIRFGQVKSVNGAKTLNPESDIRSIKDIEIIIRLMEQAK